MQKRSKHNVGMTDADKAKRTIDGIVFDSELEAKYYTDKIKPEKESKTIVNVKFHPRYILQDAFAKYGRKFQAVYYEADFEVECADGDISVIDIKGLPTEAAMLKRKLFDRRYHDKILQWIAYSKQDGGWINYDTLMKARADRKRKKKTKEGSKC